VKITIRNACRSRYVQLVGVKCSLMKPCVCGKNCATVGGNAMIAAAKMIGMTPAMLTRSGI
jgi:hypothetical protein